MKITKWIFLFLVLISCANIVATQNNKSASLKEVVLESPVSNITAVSDVDINPIEVDVFNGKIKYIEFPLLENERGEKKNSMVLCKEQDSKNPLIKKMPFLKEGGMGKLYYAEGYLSSAKTHHCYLDDRQVLTVNVKIYPYKEEFLNVDQKRVVLNKKDQARAAKEWALMQKVYQNAHQGSFINAPFIAPLDSYITSRYGKRRVFNKVKKTQHLGNDFRAKVGVSIPASNRGKVVYSGNLFFTGNVVVLDHGLGIFSLYAHLSKNLVDIGEIVEQGSIVGLSGRTGRVSGPHLHWGVKMHGHNVDGFSLVEESKQQFLSHAKAY